MGKSNPSGAGWMRFLDNQVCASGVLYPGLKYCPWRGTGWQLMRAEKKHNMASDEPAGIGKCCF